MWLGFFINFWSRIWLGKFANVFLYEQLWNFLITTLHHMVFIALLEFRQKFCSKPTIQIGCDTYHSHFIKGITFTSVSLVELMETKPISHLPVIAQSNLKVANFKIKISPILHGKIKNINNSINVFYLLFYLSAWGLREQDFVEMRVTLDLM